MNVRDDLKAYLDGELSENRRREVEQALAADPQLRAEVDEMNRIGMSLRGLARSFEGSGSTAAEAATTPRRKRKPTLWLAFAGAVCAAVIAVNVIPIFAQAKISASTAERATSSRAPIEPQANADTSVSAESAKVAAPAPGSTVEESVPLVTTRDIIRTGMVRVEVKSVNEARSKVTDGVKMLGGFIESSSVNQETEGTSTADLTLRVPSGKFEQGLDLCRATGRVVSESTSGEDVTTQRVDTEARLKALRAEEDQVLAIMRTTRRNGEVLEVRDRLSQLRMQIESMEAQLRTLKSLSSLSTITLSLTERPSVAEATKSDSGWMEDTWATAIGALKSVAEFLGRALIWALVFSPLWAPIVWWARKSRRSI